jgi:hypothetical protein
LVLASNVHENFTSPFVDALQHEASCAHAPLGVPKKPSGNAKASKLKPASGFKKPDPPNPVVANVPLVALPLVVLPLVAFPLPPPLLVFPLPPPPVPPLPLPPPVVEPPQAKKTHVVMTPAYPAPMIVLFMTAPPLWRHDATPFATPRLPRKLQFRERPPTAVL